MPGDTVVTVHPGSFRTDPHLAIGTVQQTGRPTTKEIFRRRYAGPIVQRTLSIHRSTREDRALRRRYHDPTIPRGDDFPNRNALQAGHAFRRDVAAAVGFENKQPIARATPDTILLIRCQAIGPIRHAVIGFRKICPIRPVNPVDTIPPSGHPDSPIFRLRKILNLKNSMLVLSQEGTIVALGIRVCR